MAWNDSKGNIPNKQVAGGGKTFTRMVSELNALTAVTGRYHIDFVWKGGRSGHIITAERHPNGKLTLFDPQTGREITDINYYLHQVSLKYGISVLKVDGLGVNPAKIGGIVEKRP